MAPGDVRQGEPPPVEPGPGPVDLPLQVLLPPLPFVIGFVFAARRQPPLRTPDGRPIRASRIVYTAVAAGLIAVPLGLVLGLLRGVSVFGSSLGLFVIVAGFVAGVTALTALILYAVGYALLRRPPVAAALALALAFPAVIGYWWIVDTLANQITW